MFREIVLYCAMIIFLSACGAEGFFSSGLSFNIKGAYQVSDNHYLDADLKGVSQANAQTQAQSVSAPAKIAGYISSSNDAQDCYSISGASAATSKVSLYLHEDLDSVTLRFFLVFQIYATDVNDKLEDQDLGVANMVCVDAKNGEGQYSLLVTGGTATQDSSVGNLRALLRDNADSSIDDAQTITPSSGNYNYTLNGLQNKTYTVVMSTDLDNDNVYCEVGEICGASALSSPLTATVTGHNFNHVALCTASCTEVKH